MYDGHLQCTYGTTAVATDNQLCPYYGRGRRRRTKKEKNRRTNQEAQEKMNEEQIKKPMMPTRHYK